MKYLLTLALFTLLIASSASAQYLSYGTVLQEWPMMPMPSAGMSFQLFGGAYSPTGHSGPAAQNNHFAFSGGHFLLNQTDSTFCQAGCVFDGNFATFGSVPIDKNCDELVGSLTGTYNGQPVTADYAQMWCRLPNTNHMGGGELMVVY